MYSAPLRTIPCILFLLDMGTFEAKLSKYPNHKSTLVRYLNIDYSETFDTQTWIHKQRCDQVLTSSKHHLLAELAPRLKNVFHAQLN